MKKIVLILAALVGVMTAQADNYTYLTFETTDGTKASVALESLTLSISGTTLTVGSHVFTLSNLSKMYFSTTDESGTTGISLIDQDPLTIDQSQASGSVGIIDHATAIYDLQGHKVSKKQMGKGVYIVKTTDKTYKIVVK